jgi:hypothetical protein
MTTALQSLGLQRLAGQLGGAEATAHTGSQGQDRRQRGSRAGGGLRAGQGRADDEMKASEGPPSRLRGPVLLRRGRGVDFGIRFDDEDLHLYPCDSGRSMLSLPQAAPSVSRTWASRKLHGAGARWAHGRLRGVAPGRPHSAGTPPGPCSVTQQSGRAGQRTQRVASRGGATTRAAVLTDALERRSCKTLLELLELLERRAPAFSTFLQPGAGPAPAPLRRLSPLRGRPSEQHHQQQRRTRDAAPPAEKQLLRQQQRHQINALPRRAHR